MTINTADPISVLLFVFLVLVLAWLVVNLFRRM